MCTGRGSNQGPLITAPLRHQTITLQYLYIQLDIMKPVAMLSICNLLPRFGIIFCPENGSCQMGLFPVSLLRMHGPRRQWLQQKNLKYNQMGFSVFLCHVFNTWNLISIANSDFRSWHYQLPFFSSTDSTYLLIWHKKMVQKSVMSDLLKKLIHILVFVMT